MFIDNLLAFSLAQLITVTAPSTSYIDLGVARGIGNGTGDDLKVQVNVNTTFTAAGAATLQIGLESAIDSAFTVPIVHSLTAPIPVASLVAGYQQFLAIPPELGKRFFRLKYTVATGPMTAGALTAQIVDGIQSSPIYTAVQP